MSLTLHLKQPSNRVTVSNLNKFLLDTNETIEDRIALHYNTLPRYMYVSYTSPTDIDVWNIWNVVELTTIPLYILIDHYNSHFELEQIVQLWVIYSNNLQAMLSQLLSIDAIEYYEEYEYIFNTRDERRLQLEAEYKIYYDVQLLIFNNFTELSLIPETPLENIPSPTTQLVGSFNFVGSLYSIFDVLIPSDQFPLMNYNMYYKMYQYAVLENGLNSEVGVIRVLFNHKKPYELRIYKESDRKFNFKLKSIPREEVDACTRILSDFFKDFNNIYFYQDDTHRRYKINQNINLYILTDIILTYAPFEPVIATNDENRILYEFGHVNIMYKNKWDSTQKTNIQISLKQSPNETLFSFQDDSNDTVNILSILLSKLITVYNDSVPGLYSFYENLKVLKPQSYPNQQLEQAIQSLQIQPTLLKHNPDLFTDYSRRCQLPRPPIVLEQSEKQGLEQLDLPTLRHLETRIRQPKIPIEYPPLTNEQLINKYRQLQVLQFPKLSDSHIAPPEYYICNNPDFPFPGLVGNKNVTLQYQPCCFKRDQRDTSKYISYYGGILPDEKLQTYYMIKTDKIIPPGKLGYIPEKVSGRYSNSYKCFKYATQNLEIQVLRLGIPHTPNSFLECVLTALGKNTSNLQLTRSRLLDEIDPLFLKQEMFNYTIEDIRAYIASNEFLNPLLVVRLLEMIYKCNILIFTHDTIAIPNHTRGYVQWKRNVGYPSIFVYMHNGSESDQLVIPHCELFIKAPIELPSEITTLQSLQLRITSPILFRESEPVTYFCWKVYTRLGYQSDCISQDRLEEIKEDILSGQYLDVYGKVCAILLPIKINKKNETITLWTPPLPPMNLPLFNPFEYLPSYETGLEFARSFGTIYSPPNPSEPIIVKARGFDRFYIQIHTTQNSFMYSDALRNEKLSRILINWMLFLFSDFLFQKGLDDVDSEHIELFLNETSIINSEFIYKLPLSDEFNSINRTGFFENESLIFTSHKLRESVLYQVLLQWRRNADTVIEFRQRQFMESYYKSIYDFKIRPNQILFTYDQTKETSMLKIIKPTETYPIEHYPVNQPSYFLKHPMIEQGKTVHIKNLNTQPHGSYYSYIFQDSDKVVLTRVGDATNRSRLFLVTRFSGQLLYGKITVVCH